MIRDFNTIMYEYQSILKNNENHDPIDYKNSKKSLEDKKEVKDFTVDNVILNVNQWLIFFIPILFIFFII